MERTEKTAAAVIGLTALTGLLVTLFSLKAKAAGPVYDPKFDLNKDGRIDDADKSIFLSYYLQAVNPNDPLSVACDFNGDGFVNVLDFTIFGMHYGATK